MPNSIQFWQFIEQTSLIKDSPSQIEDIKDLAST